MDSEKNVEARRLPINSQDISETGPSFVNPAAARQSFLLRLPSRLIAIGLAAWLCFSIVDLGPWPLTHSLLSTLRGHSGCASSSVHNVTWAYCEEGRPYLCANITAPLDWSNLSDPRTVKIAVTKLPARNQTHK
jgi:hypothetical protein